MVTVYSFWFLVVFIVLPLVDGQFAGTFTSETHPPLSWQQCTSKGCTTIAGTVSLDANWRWLHSKSDYSYCYEGNSWNTSLCPDGRTCAGNCALEGADYSSTYGITTTGNSISLKYTTSAPTNGVRMGSRVFVMANDTRYQLFKPLNQEISFDVDVSSLPCAYMGGFSLVAMDEDGGMARFPTNKAGAKYGTGYCDSKCPRSMKFINGEANVEEWTPSPYTADLGTGRYGSCCSEIDLWQANSISAAYTAHPCDAPQQTRCADSGCTSCDADGCDFNSFRLGSTSYYGPGSAVDSSKKFTVVTQFITDTGTSSGTLTEIRRLYVQQGKVVQNAKVNIPGISPAYNSITTPYCTDQKKTFGEPDTFNQHGGLAALSKSMSRGMVLSLSVMDDPATGLLWLDGKYPQSGNPTVPGVLRGTCSTGSGQIPDPPEGPGPKVVFSNIKIGDIGIQSTYPA